MRPSSAAICASLIGGWRVQTTKMVVILNDEEDDIFKKVLSTCLYRSDQIRRVQQS